MRWYDVVCVSLLCRGKKATLKKIQSSEEKHFECDLCSSLFTHNKTKARNISFVWVCVYVGMDTHINITDNTYTYT